MNITFIKNKLLGRKVVRTEDPKNPYLTLDDFLKLPQNFYRSMGVDIFETNKKTSVALHLVFAFQIVSVSLVIAMQLKLAWINEDFLESMQVLGYGTFGIAAVLKIVTVQLQKDKMISLVHQMRSCFPSPTEEEQEQYNVKSYFRQFNRFARIIGGLLLALVITYDVAAIGQYILQRWVLRSPNPVQSLPYQPLLPWEYRDSWRYYPTYLMESINGYTAVCGHISADIMIFAVVMQVIMHFERLSKALREFKVSNNGTDKDLRALGALIAYHNKILGLTDVMNEIFGIPLLLNFVASSLLVCNVGFQLTLGFSSEYIPQQLLFLACALVEVYLICFFSQLLIDASGTVGFATYDMNWTEADSRLRKMLLIISLRAQKPVCLKATVILNISIETMSIFLQVSFRFFCAIRSIYKS